MGSFTGLYSDEEPIESGLDFRKCVARTGLVFDEGSVIASGYGVSGYSYVESECAVVLPGKFV